MTQRPPPDENELTSINTNRSIEALKVNTSVQILYLVSVFLLFLLVFGLRVFCCCEESGRLTCAVQRGNGIGAEGGKALGEALKVNTSVQILNLVSVFLLFLLVFVLRVFCCCEESGRLTCAVQYGNGIGASGVSSIASSIKGNKTLTVLNLVSSWVSLALLVHLHVFGHLFYCFYGRVLVLRCDFCRERRVGACVGGVFIVQSRALLCSTVGHAYALQGGNPGVEGIKGIVSSDYRSIKSTLSRNSAASSKSEQDAEAYKSRLCAESICPPTLEMQKLLSSARVEAVAEHFRAKAVDCSPLEELSLQDVKLAPGVVQLVCNALQGAALQALDVTNCSLTDDAAEALLPLLESPRLTSVRVGGNSWSSRRLALMLQRCVGAKSLGLERLGDACFQPESPCLPHIAAMTSLQELWLDGFTDDCAEAVLLQCSAGLTRVSLKGAMVTQLPPSMSRLTALQSLHIDDCAELYSLPVWLKDATSLTQLSHSGCNIQYPPAASLQDPRRIREFMREAQLTATPWRRLKVVFLGNGRSGKTSLLRALARLPLDSEEQSTRGVTVDSFADKLKPNIFDKLLDGVDLELSFWDFAGQLEYSASHDFFMSNKQAVYVVVFSATDDRESQQQQLLYWLSTVVRRSLQRLIRVMVVGTKTDLLYGMCTEQALSEAGLPVRVAGGASAALPAAVGSAAASKFEAALLSMRLMVSNVLDEMGLSSEIAFASRDSVIQERGFSPVIASKEVLFTTSNTKFCIQVAAADGRAAQTLDFEHIRRALKVCLYSTCNHIFQTGDAALNYPKRFRDMTQRVEDLRKALRSEGKVT